MDNRAVNLFILNDNAEEAGKLRKYLLKRFGRTLKISLFFNIRSCIRMLDNHVDMVVVDDYLAKDGHPGMPGDTLVKLIKADHPETEVVILSSDEDVAAKVSAINTGARKYILNKKGAWHKLQTLLDNTIRQPIRYFIAEFGVKVFIFAFLAVFGALGLITYLALNFWV